jgi:hypothetical protein
MPPLLVYSHISITITTTVRTKGTPNGASTNVCKMKHTTKNLTAAPIVFESKKKNAPVL